MIQLQSIGILFCIVLACWFLAELIVGWETGKDSAHLFHGPNDGCLECEDK